ncbi:hypothetical protein [Paraburkholderia sediminicola]|uniref:hypothetical protein n=1 Tax=Paraburkholderia sediminicola TaxID=458836 RepID=UPI0038B94D67
MSPAKFVIRYTAVPLIAIAGVVIWTSVPASKEIDARQYAALSDAYTDFPPQFRREIAGAMKHDRITDWDYQALARQSLKDGIALDWPATGASDVIAERHKLAVLVHSDPYQSGNQK